MTLLEHSRIDPTYQVDPATVETVFTAELTGEEPDFERIIREYQKGSPAARIAINDTLISLCGWSLLSLIRKAHLLEEVD